MATFRVGVGSFNINDGSVGIGTEGSGHGNLKVEGTIKSTNLDVLGVSTFTRYSGFSADEINVNNRNLTLSGEYSTTGDIVVEDNASLTVGLGSTACVGSLEYICVKNHFSVPSGNTVQRNEVSGYVEGTIRFNSDLGTLEFFNGSEWTQFNYQADIQNSPSGRGRGIIQGYTYIEYVNVSTTGNTKQFGTEPNNLYGGAGASNETRGLFMGGWGPGNQDFDVSYITMASEGDAIDFGENNTGGWGSTGASDSVRALSAGGGYPSASATIDMFLFSSVGVKYDWGDITAARGRGDHGVCSPVRAIFTGGYGPIHARYDTKITASTGNTTDFGEIMYGGRGGTAIGDRTRGIITGGYQDDPVATAYVNTNRMEAIQLQSTGVAVDFGEISDQQQGLRGGAQNMVRGIVFGGAPSSILSIDMVNFQTYGSAAEFGEMATGRHSQVGLSDSHGGLGGY